MQVREFARSGGCRRHSPSTMGQIGNRPEAEVECSVAWPVTDSDDWCGDAREIDSEQLEQETTANSLERVDSLLDQS
jgi:hypothetical protein